MDSPSVPSTATQQPALHTQAEAALAGSAALTVSRFTLQLPRDANFVDAPLPGPDPNRYRSWMQLSRIWVGKSQLQYATFLDDERLILAHSEAETGVRVYQRDSRKLLANHELSFEPFTSPGPVILLWSPSSTWFLLGNENGLQLYDALTGAPVSALNARPVSAMRWSPDGNVLVVCTTPAPDRPSQLTFYRKQGAREPHDVVALQELGKMPLPGRVEGWDLSRDNRLLAVSLYPQEQVLVFDLPSGEVVAQLSGPKYAADLSISADGRWLAVGGQGVLLVDLANPTRRAFYSYYHNNIASVRFSPSGDALLTSSYDGRIRIFSYETETPTLSLIKTLSHDGQANVYSIQFTEDGNGLLSASGDQTLRLFGVRNTSSSARLPPGRFRSLTDWRANLPATVLATGAPSQPSVREGHYHPPQLDAPARPSKVRPGVYECRIAAMYKLRECIVRQTTSGHALLEFHRDNLLALTGVLYDDGPVVRYEAWLTEPSTLVGCAGCEQQPLHGMLRGNGGRYKGLLTFRNYYDPRVPPPSPDSKAIIEDANDRFELVLNYKGPLPELHKAD
ncbi:MAG TPA: hypothetical protein VHO25_01635 [Polyangiaceae bacterium]|nr:hypothetical protein [Polyangiaceae bacterium]